MIALIPHKRGTGPARFPLEVGVSLAVLALATLAGCNNFSAAGRNAEGVRLYRQARFAEALQQFQEATYADPANADGYYNLAATYHRIGVRENRQTDLDQAENYYNMCLDICDRNGADHTECYRGLAVLLAEQGRDDESFRLLEGWVDRKPGSAEAKVELARLFDEYGDQEAAKQHLIEALAVGSQDPATLARARAALGKIREDMGEYEQALANYQRAYQYDRSQPQLATRIAALQSQLGIGTLPTVSGGGTRLVGQASASLR